VASVGAGINPRPVKSDVGPTVSVSAALLITQRLESGRGLWCMGQMAWSPCVHVHSSSSSADPTHKTAGASVSVATWHKSHTIATLVIMRRMHGMR
jgi:hypothetical protein